jgi:hypothetical protein
MNTKNFGSFDNVLQTTDFSETADDNVHRTYVNLKVGRSSHDFDKDVTGKNEPVKTTLNQAETVGSFFQLMKV